MIGSGIRGKALWNEEFKFLVLERVKDLIKDSDAVHSSVCSAHESPKFFLVFALDCPFGFSP